MHPRDLRRMALRGLEAKGVTVLFEDGHLLAVSKPAGLLSQGGPPGVVSLPDLVDAYRRESEAKPGRAYVGLVHRLDRNVSGVLVVAKTSKAAARLAKAFREREDVEKTYLAWVTGRPDPSEGQLLHRLVRSGGVTRVAQPDDPGAKPARLAYATVGVGPTASRLRLDLATGRSHQIRAQLAVAGHPIVGDTKYGGPRGARPALHAWRLAFAHPVGGARVRFEAPVPDDLRALDRALRVRPPFAD